MLYILLNLYFYWTIIQTWTEIQNAPFQYRQLDYIWYRKTLEKKADVIYSKY